MEATSLFPYNSISLIFYVHAIFNVQQFKSIYSLKEALPYICFYYNDIVEVISSKDVIQHLKIQISIYCAHFHLPHIKRNFFYNRILFLGLKWAFCNIVYVQMIVHLILIKNTICYKSYKMYAFSQIFRQIKNTTDLQYVWRITNISLVTEKYFYQN